MNNAELDMIRHICSRFPEVQEDNIRGRPMFHVRRRIIAIYYFDDAPDIKRWRNFGRSLHFATDEATRGMLRHDDRFAPSAHHGFRGWMALSLEDDVDWHEVNLLLIVAYKHVANRALVQQMQGDSLALT